MLIFSAFLNIMVLTLPRDMDEVIWLQIFASPLGDKLKVLAFVFLSQEANIDINKR